MNFFLQGLVCAGMADMTRPAEKLSTAQSAVLMATGKASGTLYLYTLSTTVSTLYCILPALSHLHRKGSVC